jgi:hypothetical protein
MKREIKRINIKKNKGYIKIPEYLCDRFLAEGNQFLKIEIDDDKEIVYITGVKDGGKN